MGTRDSKNLSEIVGVVKSWIPQRKEPAIMSRDFWMPDQSCRVCYDCDSQFTVFNRRHHCRLCGRVFCARCTTNSVPAVPDEAKNGQEDVDRIRVCNYCFKQWKQGLAVGENGMPVLSSGLSSSPSSSSLVSNQSSCYSINSCSSAGSVGCATGPFQHVSSVVGQTSGQSMKMDSMLIIEDPAKSYGKLEYLETDDTFADQFGSCSRSDEEDDVYPFNRSHSEATLLSPDICSAAANCGNTDQIDKQNVHPSEENTSSTFDLTPPPKSSETYQADVPDNTTPSNYLNDANIVAVDYENNGLLWVPPEPEDEEDERETLLSEDDDDTVDDTAGKWGYLRSNSFDVGGESRNRDRSSVEHQCAMKKVVDSHFRALITQLLQAENIPTISQDNVDESWLDIITKLSWEAANLLKPDTSMGGGMDPGGYVKVKCIACGHRNQSVVVKGVVCKKNVAHRRMTSKVNKARLLLLGGALEYQRVANHLSSFDTLLQQEMEHLKMAVAKIDAHHPNVLLVEKSVSRYAQDYLLAKDISLVLNVKRQLLERIARCTGAHIVPSIDNLSSTRLGYCDSFHVEKLLEDLGSAGQPGKKLTKTLMFFEDCPKPLGCTILLKGASGDELKKIKHILQYAVFAAYHLALETSFLADEGACLPDLPLTSPIKVALPDRPSGIDKSISMIPGYNPFQTGNNPFLDIRGSSRVVPTSEAECFPSVSSGAQTPNAGTTKENIDITEYDAAVRNLTDNSSLVRKLCNVDEVAGDDELGSNHYKYEDSGQGINLSHADANSNSDISQLVPLDQINSDVHGELGSFKEDFAPSPSDQQSILVSLSTRCVWKGSVCERSHLFRIKYYGNFDKPLGRFLRDQLFDQEYQCQSCEMPSEAHIHCYTHQQGCLTISVKKLPGSPLAGDREGKIWMWHRCLRCPRIDGFPPATKRVLMSDAAWGLSFGKFLELSFSNHAAASRLATCGHSIHRDCLRFYGFGRMVACFRYAPINVHSVHLPPSEVEFNYYEQEWILEDLDEFRSKATRLFSEVSEVIHQISSRIAKETSSKVPRSGQQIVELDSMLQMEKREFEESWCVLNEKTKSGKTALDILETNKLRRKLVFLAYVWDQRLIHSDKPRIPNKSSSMKETPIKGSEMSEIPTRPRRSFTIWDYSRVNLNPDIAPTEAGGISQNSSPNGSHERTEVCETLSTGQDLVPCHSSVVNSETQEFVKTVRRSLSEGRFPGMENLSDNFDTGWAGNRLPPSIASEEKPITQSPQALNHESSPGISMLEPDSNLPAINPSDVENPSSWVRIPFSLLYRSLNKIYSENAQKLSALSNYSPVYISSFRELVHLGGARILLPVSTSDIILPVYDDEPTSIISYALTTADYYNFMSDVPEKKKDLGSSTSFSILETVNLLSLPLFDDTPSESLKTAGSTDQQPVPTAGSRNFSGLDSFLFSNSLHAQVSFSDDGSPGKVRYSVTCYFAKQFEALRRICCPSELDFLLSLSRCKKWGAQGGKSNVFFAKTLDNRFIIKQVTKTELESFIRFAPSYFKYLSESISTGCPTCLAKVLGIYQVTSKHVKGGKESRMDVLVMENLLFGRNLTRIYDLKGSSRSRYNPDSSGSNKVLLDQNLIEAMPTSPIFLGTKAKRLLERAVWNDTAFLASIDVMDYSLLVGVDEENNELVVGIIDFMRQYTWDKHLETWVKTSGILGGPKNASPTVISPKQYKKRFRKAMSAYFLMVPDQWSSSLNFSKESQTGASGGNSKDNASPSTQHL